MLRNRKQPGAVITFNNEGNKVIFKSAIARLNINESSLSDLSIPTSPPPQENSNDKKKSEIKERHIYSASSNTEQRRYIVGKPLSMGIKDTSSSQPLKLPTGFLLVPTVNNTTSNEALTINNVILVVTPLDHEQTIETQNIIAKKTMLLPLLLSTASAAIAAHKALIPPDRGIWNFTQQIIFGSCSLSVNYRLNVLFSKENVEKNYDNLTENIEKTSSKGYKVFKKTLFVYTGVCSLAIALAQGTLASEPYFDNIIIGLSIFGPSIFSTAVQRGDGSLKFINKYFPATAIEEVIQDERPELKLSKCEELMGSAYKWAVRPIHFLIIPVYAYKLIKSINIMFSLFSDSIRLSPDSDGIKASDLAFYISLFFVLPNMLFFDIAATDAGNTMLKWRRAAWYFYSLKYDKERRHDLPCSFWATLERIKDYIVHSVFFRNIVILLTTIGLAYTQYDSIDKGGYDRFYNFEGETDNFAIGLFVLTMFYFWGVNSYPAFKLHTEELIILIDQLEHQDNEIDPEEAKFLGSPSTIPAGKGSINSPKKHKQQNEKTNWSILSIFCCCKSKRTGNSYHRLAEDNHRSLEEGDEKRNGAEGNDSNRSWFRWPCW